MYGSLREGANKSSWHSGFHSNRFSALSDLGSFQSDALNANAVQATLYKREGHKDVTKHKSWVDLRS